MGDEDQYGKDGPSKPDGAANPYQSPVANESGSLRPEHGHVDYREPHRGTLVLLLGLGAMAGFVLSFVCWLPMTFATAPIGLAAWLMARHDIRKIDQGYMDERGRSQTVLGSVIGLTFGIFSLLVSIGILCFVALIIFGATSSL